MNLIEYPVIELFDFDFENGYSPFHVVISTSAASALVGLVNKECLISADIFVSPISLPSNSIGLIDIRDYVDTDNPVPAKTRLAGDAMRMLTKVRDKYITLELATQLQFINYQNSVTMAQDHLKWSCKRLDKFLAQNPQYKEQIP